MVRFLPILVWLVMTVYALVDVAQTDQRRLGEVPKGLWVLGIVVLPFVGALTWLLVGKRRAAPLGRHPLAGPARSRRTLRSPWDAPAAASHPADRPR